MAEKPVKTAPAAKPAAKNKSVKPAKQKVGRKCTICHHEQVGQINTAIHKGVAFRVISRQIKNNDTARDAIRRHTENCLKIEVAALIQQKKTEQAVDVIAEFKEQLVFTKKLRSAAEMYLSDPLDPLKIAINPFSHEISVSYFDYTELLPSGAPTKKTAPLSNLLNAVQEIGKMIMASDANVDGDMVFGKILQIDKISVRHVDLRSFALDAIKTTDMCLDKFAKISGIYQQDRENEQKVQRMVTAIEQYLENHPDADRPEVYKHFAKGRGVPIEKVHEHFGVIG